MKRLFALFTACIMIITFTACSKTKLSLEHECFEDVLIKVDYSEKYKVNDEYAEVTVDKNKGGAKLPECNVAVYQNESLLVQVHFYQKNDLRDLYTERIEALKRYADPNREKTPAEKYTTWEIVDDKTTEKSPYIIAKCISDSKNDKPAEVNYEYLALISEEEQISVRFLCENTVDEKTLRDIIKNVKFSAIKK